MIIIYIYSIYVMLTLWNMLNVAKWQSGKVARAEQNLFGYAERKSLRA